MGHFELFSIEHILSIGGYILFYIIFFCISVFFKKSFALTISCSVAIIKVAELVIRHGVYGETLNDLIPIHLCR